MHQGRLFEIKYTFVVACDLACAPDIEVHLPMVIFSPSPPIYGLAALGLSAPVGVTFSFATAPQVSGNPPLNMGVSPSHGGYESRGKSFAAPQEVYQEAPTSYNPVYSSPSPQQQQQQTSYGTYGGQQPYAPQPIQLGGGGM